MLLFLKRMFLALAIIRVTVSASAFSLLGPYDTTYQVVGIGYALGGDIGGPMNLGQEYRWNIKTITYGFTPEFWNYFGAHGTAAVMQAMAVLNNLPPFTQMSSNLTEYALDTRRINYQANALELLDLKTWTLGAMMEELGLASPDRYVWTLRDRVTPPGETNYTVIMRSFDPITLAPSMYVNGTLYTYDVVEPIPLVGGGGVQNIADAVENTDLDPLAPTETAVASMVDNNSFSSFSYVGTFLTGLTRDDVGGLRYLYDGSWFNSRYANVNTETLIPGTTASAPAWWPFGQPLPPVADQALRPGVDHITFKLYPSTYGFYDNWNVVTQQYTDSFSTNGTLLTQNTARGLSDGAGNGLPDIIFDAQDIGDVQGVPLTISRTIAADPVWVNNSALNNPAQQAAGPGQINGPITITFNSVGPYFINDPAFFSGPGSAAIGPIWGSFDGTTNPPVIYPNLSVQDRLQQLQYYGY